MKRTNYDVIVVGAGPAGIFACLELVKLQPHLNIALIDMGSRVEKRNNGDVMSGFGGAGTYSDGKLQFTPKLSHERTFHLITSDNYQKILDSIDTVFMKYGVTGTEYPRNKKEVQWLVEEAERKGMELIVRKAKHVGTNKLHAVIKKMQA